LKGPKRIPQISQENLWYLFFEKNYFSDFLEKSEKSFFRKKYTTDFLEKSEKALFLGKKNHSGFLRKSEVSFLDLSNKRYFSGSKKTTVQQSVINLQFNCLLIFSVRLTSM